MSTAILSIIKGVQKTPGDTKSAEQGLDSIDLLDPQGFALRTEDGYIMNIPALKSSSVWADTPQTPGRQLIAGEVGNVTETIRLTVHASTNVQLAAMLAKMGRMIGDCRNFWITRSQIEPVYIKHQVVGEPGPRYALLYNIDMVVEPPETINDTTRDVTLSIEREGAWRGVSPGDNPKRWNIENNLAQTFTLADASLITTTKQLSYSTIANKLEFATISTIGANRNFVDIPAASIPGDAPALLCLLANPSYDSDTGIDLFVSRVSKPLSLPDRDDGTILPHYLDFSAAASLSLGTDTTFTTDNNNGIAYPPISANLRVATVSFATVATATSRVVWSANTGTNPHMDWTLLQGRYMVFLRARQNSGAAGNTTAYIEYADAESGVFATSNTVTLPLATDSPTTTDIPLTYMGIINIPLNGRSQSLVSGGGLKVSDSVTEFDSGFSMLLYVARSTGAATVTIVDIVFVPIDEGCIRLTPPSSIGSAGIYSIYDETGYFNHGLTELFTTSRVTSGSLVDVDLPVEPRGSPFNLVPGKTNRLYFLYQKFNGTHAEPLGTLTVSINIVPRWYGLRDT